MNSRENRFRPLALLLAGLVLIAAGAAAQVAGLYYQEIRKDNAIYLFNTSERYQTFVAKGEMGKAITLQGRGPKGETLIAENETAIDLFLFKNGLPAWDRPAPKPVAPPAPTFPQVKVGAMGFLAYQDGKLDGADYSKFVVKRAYINVNATVTPHFSVRVTPDVFQDATTGDMKVRLKFGYGLFSTAKAGFLTKPYVELGMIRLPWLDWEEKVNRYRMQDSMFLERSGMTTGADLGVAVGGLFGGEMPEAYQKDVSSAYPGRYGSFVLGVYNGGGFAASEKNSNKVLQGRLTLRPMPDLVSGLQLSYFGISGKGNTAAEPDYQLNAGTLSYEGRHLTLVGTWMSGKGNPAGTAVDSHGNALEREGLSGFAELKMGAWSVIGRYDDFQSDTTQDLSELERLIYGVSYHLGKGNDLLVDYEEVRYENPAKPKDQRLQLTLQFNF